MFDSTSRRAFFALPALAFAAFLTACEGDATDTDDTQATDDAATREAQDARRIAVLEARVDATNRADWNAWEALHTEGACRTAPELPGPLCGAAAMRGAIEALGTAFPDYHLEIVDVTLEGDRAAVRIHTTGTMDGPLVLSEDFTLPPLHKPIVQDWVALVRFEGDKIARFDEFYDQYALLLQLGLVAPLGGE